MPNDTPQPPAAVPALRIPRNAPGFVRSAYNFMRSAGPYLGVLAVFCGYAIVLLEALKVGCERGHALSVDRFGSTPTDTEEAA